MADLSTNFVGIKSPNPFWLASAPPTDKEYNVRRAFEAGWGGVVWKTLGEAGPPVVNVNGPRYGVIYGADRRVLGINNIELITDRPLETNLEEMTRVKKDFPDRALIASIMVPCEEQAWKAILPRVEDTGCDGIELNFGCPHGMSERGMGSAVGQVPEYIQMVAEWCKMYTHLPVNLLPRGALLQKRAFAVVGPAPLLRGVEEWIRQRQAVGQRAGLVLVGFRDSHHREVFEAWSIVLPGQWQQLVLLRLSTLPHSHPEHVHQDWRFVDCLQDLTAQLSPS